MLKQLLIVVSLVSWGMAAIAGDTREIQLRDGGVIQGEIQAFDGNQYTIKSESLGTIRLDRSNIAAIVAPRSSDTREDGAGSARARASAGELSTLTQQMLKDRETMNLIHSLRNNPQVQAIINDPELMQAISRGDLATLRNDPRIQSLLQNPTVQEITSKTLSR